VPTKLVSRRSMSRTRLLSALPRNAVISCRRSVSLRGRKSIRSYSLPLKVTVAQTSQSAFGCQFRQEKVNAAIDPFFLRVYSEKLLTARDEVTNVPPFQHHRHLVSGFRQRDVHGEGRSVTAGDHFESHAGLLQVETFQLFRVQLNC